MAKILKQFLAWSFSRWKDHTECPRFAKLKHLDKIPEGAKGPALIRGEKIHKLAEDYVKGTLKKFPAELKMFEAEFKELRKQKAVTEGKWAMNVAWKVADFFDWVGAWCRVVLDAHLKTGKRARVIDYKTGKIYGDNEEQLELYAISGFVHYPDVEFVDVELWYLDQPREANQKKPGANPKLKTYKRSDLAKLQKKWKTKVIPMLSDKKFPPRPGPKCKYCAYSERKGGKHCEF